MDKRLADLMGLLDLERLEDNLFRGQSQDLGWGTVDLGGIDCSRYLEPMCLVWVLYGARSNTWNHAFKLLRS